MRGLMHKIVMEFVRFREYRIAIQKCGKKNINKLMIPVMRSVNVANDPFIR
jgi:hypothetical protein